MDDIYEIRFRHLNDLYLRFVAEVLGGQKYGSILKLAQVLGASERYLAHLLGRRKKIGSATARKYEAALGLPKGHLDQRASFEDRVGGLSEDEADLLEIVLKLMRQLPEPTRQTLAVLSGTLRETSHGSNKKNRSAPRRIKKVVAVKRKR